jgi:hypothetical protein
LLPSSIFPLHEPLSIPRSYNTFISIDKMAAEGQEISEELKAEQAAPVPAQEDGVDEEVREIGVVPLY